MLLMQFYTIADMEYLQDIFSGNATKPWAHLSFPVWLNAEQSIAKLQGALTDDALWSNMAFL